MNLGVQLPKTMPLPILGSSRMTGDGVSDQFPAGLRVLVVDDDPTCLMILDKMLRTCLYEVTKSNRAEKALSLLRENRNGYDIIISDVHMPDMDGFKLLEHVGLEMDLPVITDDSKSVVMKGVTHGACDYLIKPVRMEALKNIWQHVVRKKKNEWKDIEQTRSIEEGEQQQHKPNDEVDYSSSANEGNRRHSKRRNEEDEEGEDKDDTSALKKPRVVWSVELHQQFMAAVDQLGVDKAVPKKILEMMNVPGLTRENVASHLQKYRLYLRRVSGSHHQGGIGNSFMGSINGLDLQALAASGHLPPQSLANLQAATLARSLPKSTIPILDQRNNIFSFENPSSNNNNVSRNKEVNLLHGIPTTMEPQQLSNFRGINMQQNPRNNGNNPHLSMVQNKTGFSSNGVFNNGNELVTNVRASAYNPLNRPSMVNFSSSQGNTDKGLVRNDPSYDIFSELAQHKTTENWDLQNIGMSFETTQHVNTQSNSNGLNVQPSVLVHQGFSLGKNGFQNRNGNGMFLGEGSVRVKSESNQENIGQNMLFSDQFGQEDLLSALLKQNQQQDGIGQVSNDFGFGGFPPLDNLPV